MCSHIYRDQKVPRVQTKDIKQESPASETKNSDQNNPATAEGNNQDATASSLTALDGLDYTRSKLVSSSTVYKVVLRCNVMGTKDLQQHLSSFLRPSSKVCERSKSLLLFFLFPLHLCPGYSWLVHFTSVPRFLAGAQSCDF